MVEAVENAVNNQSANYKLALSLKKIFVSKLKDTGLVCTVNSNENCSPYIVSVSFVGCRAETILNMISDKGICVGNGSACSSKKSGNRVLESMGKSKSEIEGNLRISFSKYTTEDEVNRLVVELSKVVREYLIKVS